MDPTSAALAELLRGLEAADVARGDGWLARADPRDVLGALRLTALRLVFLRLARDLLPPRGLRDAADPWAALHARAAALRRAGGGPLFADQPELAARPVPSTAILRAMDLLSDGPDDVARLGATHAAMLAHTLTRGDDGRLRLGPGVERRRSGSHYTPRALAGPIVEAALAPPLADLGPHPAPAQLQTLFVCDPAAGGGAFLVEACRALADRLVDAWRRAGDVPSGDPDMHARAQVVARCVRGVDLDPLAVALARLSLWIFVGDAHAPLSAHDRAVRRGDSLLGLSRAHIAALRWAGPVDPCDTPVEPVVGDALVHAFFRGGDTPRARARARAALAPLVARAHAGDPAARAHLTGLAAALRTGPSPLVPFHWELEFPDVFARDRPGFDCVVGNPPFLAGGRISATLGPAYLDWLLHVHEDSHGNADLVAHFLRRAFGLLRRGGALGLLATNTVAQGDTRATGLRWIARNGGHIYRAERRAAWPGDAAVIVSAVHLRRGPPPPDVRLDGRPVPRISAFLSHAGGDDDPAPLRANAGLAFLGSKIYGQGFLFADGVAGATPLAEMARLVAADPRNAERIAPYLGGEEVNRSPTHRHHRHVIDFGDMSEGQARQWPDLMAIVEARVRPQRERQNRAGRARRWWCFGETAPGLAAAIRGLPRVLVVSRVSRSLAFTFLAPGQVYSEQLVVFALPQFAALALLQSRVHAAWARFFGSSMKDDLRYTPSDCFDTFPLPPAWQGDPLDELGRRFHERRAAAMIARGEGLTTTHDRLRDATCTDPALLDVRDLLAAIDRAVLAAYGWTDLAARAAVEPGVDGRLRWPQALHDDVLARLLDLNRTRAADEGARSA